jgi:hypothetical protein
LNSRPRPHSLLNQRRLPSEFQQGAGHPLSVGYEARRAGIEDFTTLYVFDSDSAKTLDCYAISVSRAATLQQQIHDEQISFDALVSAIMREIQPMKLPPRLFGNK